MVAFDIVCAGFVVARWPAVANRDEKYPEDKVWRDNEDEARLLVFRGERAVLWSVVMTSDSHHSAVNYGLDKYWAPKVGEYQTVFGDSNITHIS